MEIRSTDAEQIYIDTVGYKYGNKIQQDSCGMYFHTKLNYITYTLLAKLHRFKSS